MYRALLKSLLFATSLWLLAGPLAILQLGAWGWMIASYAQESDLQQAVEDTFSGERPCAMCSMIVKVEETEQRQTKERHGPKAKDLKLLPIPYRAAPTPNIRICISDTIDQQLQYLQVGRNVPTPPPRGFA